MFDHLLESSHWDDSNKWSNIDFTEDIAQLESNEVNLNSLSEALHNKDVTFIIRPGNSK